MPIANPVQSQNQGILLVNKPSGMNSFRLVVLLRKRLNLKKIGHAGTLDPFATGVMVLLAGKKYTTQSNQFLTQDKEYAARVRLGVTTDSYDRDGKIMTTSDHVPSLEEVENAIATFQGTIQQTPPMFSAKKIGGKKLYELAREGKEIERPPITTTLETDLVKYAYPYIDIVVRCSKGTYIRSIAHDLGQLLGCGAHLEELTRTRSGHWSLDQCVDGSLLESSDFDPRPYLIN